MTERRYDLPAMREFIDFLNKQKTELTDTGMKVQRTAEGVLSQFQGQAAEGFREAHQEWQRSFAQHLESITRLRDRIQTTHDNYQEAETVILQRFPGTGRR